MPPYPLYVFSPHPGIYRIALDESVTDHDIDVVQSIVGIDLDTGRGAAGAGIQFLKAATGVFGNQQIASGTSRLGAVVD